MALVKRFTTAMLAGTIAIVAGVLSSAALGLPAGLPAGAVGGTDAFGSSCDHDGVGTTLRTAFDAAEGYTITAVVVDGIDGDCAGHRLSVALTGAAGRMVTEGGPLLVAAGGGVLTVPVAPVTVESVARVHTLLD
jgi:hypothetical protein